VLGVPAETEEQDWGDRGDKGTGLGVLGGLSNRTGGTWGPEEQDWGRLKNRCAVLP